ncbi:MAG: hypothetical protein ISR47_09485 [Rhodospirillales bacterium]|nr:hypothetical protein [Rhodospirillales bacterium]
MEAALDRPLDPEAMARVEGFAHRTEKEKVSLFGTHMVPVATYPLSEKSAPVDPTYGPVWSRSVFDRHSISVFKEEIVEQGVQPKSVQFEKTAFPDLTAIAVAFGPLSADMLTGKANASLVDALSDPYRLENSMTVTKEQKTSPWTGAKHPSIPIEIDGELYGVRGNAEPSAPPKASPSITNPVQERLNAAGYAPGIPQEIAKDYAAGRTSGLTHEEALDHAYGQAQQAAKAKDNMEQTGNLYDAAAKEANEMWANIFDEKPTAVNGSERKVVSAARWSAGDLRATAPEALPTPSTHHPTKTAEDSKVAKNERQKAISMGANTYGVGGALQGLKNAEAAQARTDARNAAQENQDAANRQLEISEQDIERHLGSLPEKPFTITPRNQRTLGRPSFAPSGEFNVEDIQLSIPEGATLSAGTDNGLGGRGRSLQGARQRGAEAVVPGRYSGSKPVGNEGKRGTKRISPGGSHQSGSSVGPQAVTSSSGAAVRSASGAVVTTGQKPGLGEYDGGRHGGGDRRVICTHFVAKRLMSPALQRIDMQFTHERLSAATVRGYHFWAVPYVRLMRRGGILARMASRVMLPIATWRAEEIAHQMGNGGYGPNVKGKIVRLIMEPLCRLIGTFVKPTNYLKLYEEETLR